MTAHPSAGPKPAQVLASLNYADHLRHWLGSKLTAERDLLTVAEKAAAACEVYEDGRECGWLDGNMDRFDEAMGALGYALAEYAAKHRRA